MYYDKWWKSHGRWPDSGNCLKKEFSMKEKAAVNALGVVNIGGVFVVLLVGLAFAVTVAIGKFKNQVTLVYAISLNSGNN